MKSKRHFVFILVFAIALFPALVSSLIGQGIGDRNRASGSEGGNFSIQGRVIMPDGTPSKNVKVSISSTDTNTFTITDQDGIFQTRGTTRVNYTISAKVEDLPIENESVVSRT